MKKTYLLIAVLSICFNSIAQTTAGKSFYIDYATYQSDGLLRYINCGNNDILNPGDSLSMEAWVKVSQQSVNDNLKIFGKFGLDNTGYLFGKEASELYCEMWTPSHKEIKAGFMPPVAHWAHMVCTFAKNGKIKAYVNGILVGEQNAGSSGIATSTNNLIIGIAPWDLASFQFFGSLDNVRIWNKELSAEEVRHNMHHSINGNETGLIAAYEFNNTLDDHSGYENHGTGQNLSDTNYQDSYAVIANSTMSQMNDIYAVWLGISTGTPNVNQITDNGLTLSATIYGDEHVLFGHNDASGTSIENLPINSPTNFERQQREWYIQPESVNLGTLKFSLSNGANGAESLSTDKDANYYTLLFRNTTNEDYTAIKAGNVKIADVISFEGVSLNEGYYTIAVGDEAIPELLSLEETSLLNSSIFPNPSKGNFTLSHTKEVTIVITDLLGNKISEQGLSKKHQLQLESCSKGIYLIEMRAKNGEQIVKQIVVQ